MAGSPATQPIITPEAVVLDFERAGVASRTIAFAIDTVALAATVVVLLIVASILLGDLGGGGGAAVVAALASLGAVIVWFCAFETLWQGRTLGKAAMGLRAVSADGTTIRFQQAFLRAAVGVVDFFLVPIGFVAVVTLLVSPRDQRLGDMAAGTLVVRERAANAFVAPAWFPAPPGWERYAGSLDVTALDEGSYGLVRSYLLRVPELSAGARDHLAVRLANPVAVRMGHTPPSYVHPHLFLLCVAARWQGSVSPAPPASGIPGGPQRPREGEWQRGPLRVQHVPPVQPPPPSNGGPHAGHPPPSPSGAGRPPLAAPPVPPPAPPPPVEHRPPPPPPPPAGA